WHKLRSDGGPGFADYLETARTGAKEARRRAPRPVQVIEPGRGMGAALLDAFEDNASYAADEDPVHLRWRRLDPDEVFRIDRGARTSWLNRQDRAELGGSGRMANDAPVVKALLHLRLGEHFGGSYKGHRERRVEAAWHAILLAAVREQRRILD